MLALTYGMMPRAKIERFPKAPPLNMLKRLKRLPLCLWTTAFATGVIHARIVIAIIDPVHRHQDDGEYDPPAQLGDFPDVGEGGEMDIASP